MRFRVRDHVTMDQSACTMWLLTLVVCGAVTSSQAADMYCGPSTQLSVAWADLPPYIFPRHANPDGSFPSDGMMFGEDDPEGALHGVLYNMTTRCCDQNYSLQFLPSSGSPRELEQMHGEATLILPVTREPAMVSLDDMAVEHVFLPVIHTPGSFILVDTSRVSNTILVALAGSWPLALVIIAAAGVAGIIIWLMERRHNDKEFPKGFLIGAGEGTWWAFVTMTTVGYGDKSPKSLLARIFGLVWMFAGIVLVSVFTATLVIAFDSEGKIGDIKGSKVAVIWGSFEEHQAFYEGATTVAYPNITAVIQGLKNHEVDAALVELNYALYALQELKEEGIEADHLIKQESVHGILVQGLSNEVVHCFAREISRSRFNTMDFIMRRTGKLQRKSSSAKVGERTNKLMAMNILVAYILFAIWLGLVIVCLLWEFLYFRKLKDPLASQETMEQDNGNTRCCLQPMGRTMIHPQSSAASAAMSLHYRPTPQANDVVSTLSEYHGTTSD